jgi:hypothetical protein
MEGFGGRCTGMVAEIDKFSVAETLIEYLTQNRVVVTSL